MVTLPHTGMRENYTKREGLAMGKFRNKKIGRGVKWVNEGEWVISLGVPIGNEINHEEWWDKKVASIDAKAHKWINLYRHSYSGRNLLVQSMYYGSFRYWLYSTHSSKKTINKIAASASRMLWAKDPTVNTNNRYRRWIRGVTAIGPRSLGGINEMDWISHNDAFHAEWILRYVRPGNEAWKQVLDTILLINKDGTEKFVEERGILFYNLPRLLKIRLIKTIPKKRNI